MIVVLDNLRSALNVGSILRSCDAFEIKEVWVCGITPGPENPKVIKTSLGAEKSIKIEHFKSTTEAIKRLKALSYYIVCLEINEKARDISTLKNKGSFALIVGNEVSGISPEVQEACDILVKIPMKGIKESLNVAVAFGIAGFLLTRKS